MVVFSKSNVISGLAAASIAGVLAACGPVTERNVAIFVDGVEVRVRMTEWVGSAGFRPAITYEVEFEGDFYRCQSPNDCESVYRRLAGLGPEPTQEDFAESAQEVPRLEAYAPPVLPDPPL